jgi:hypothetical protein
LVFGHLFVKNVGIYLVKRQQRGKEGRHEMGKNGPMFFSLDKIFVTNIFDAFQNKIVECRKDYYF